MYATMTDLDKLRLSIEKSARYHEMRQGFLDACHEWVKVLTVILGSTAASTLLGTSTDIAAYSALLLTALNAVDIVVGTSRKSAAHARLRERFLELRAECLDQIDESRVVSIKRKMAMLDAQEPPIHETVNIQAYNAAARARNLAVFPLSKTRAIVGMFIHINLPDSMKPKAPLDLSAIHQNPSHLKGKAAVSAE